MRIFIGIQLNEEVKHSLAIFQGHIKSASIKGNFSRKENFHLTICFIGEVEEGKLVHLEEQLRKTLSDCSSFRIESGNPGVFEKKSGMIAWVGIKENFKLEEIYKKTKQAIAAAKFPVEERDYIPHITMGRKIRFAENAKDWTNNMPTFSEMIDAITIFQSHQVNGLLTYTPLIEIKL